MTILTIQFTLSSCSGRDEHPHLKDPLYQEIEKELKGAESAISEAEAAVAEAQRGVNTATPQTGQFKFAKKRLFGAEHKLRMANQRVVYLKLKLDNQEWVSKEEYLIALQQNKPWPTNDGLAHHILQAEQIGKSKNWSSSERRESMGLPNSVPGKGMVPSAPPKKEAAASGGAHH